MPRRLRPTNAGLVFHVMNRGAKRLAIFNDPADYCAFERLLTAASTRFPVAVFAYCLMPNHWHLVTAPGADAVLSRFMHWLTGTHACRWHTWRYSAGQGAVYQGRYKAIPVSTDHHFLTVCRYVEMNPVRAALVSDAGDWEWSSLYARLHGTGHWLAEWPVTRPPDWVSLLRAPQTDSELAQVRSAIQCGQPLGDDLWTDEVRRRLAIKKPQLRGRRRARNGSVLQK